MSSHTRRTGRSKRLAIAACLVSAFASLLPLGAPARAADGGAVESPRMDATPPARLLDTGFNDLYELNFEAARAEFLSYQKAQPQDPLGTAAEAASYLYEQFHVKGIFTSEFFLNDARFLRGADGSPAQNHNEPFLRANGRAQNMAREQLKSKPTDARALLALTMADGMEADYDALIVKKQMAGLGMTRQAESEAGRLLALDPSAEDAYLALGAANYVIGSLPVYKRAFLWFGGIHGDRARGMEQLQRAADRGHYLRPFAKAWLALACEREHQLGRARALFAELSSEFPANPLFARELASLDRRSARR
ncbi:MAG TPA: hypothetical protein VJO53_10370 [Candidatus Acidoferrales bacterium]|nr:hypothetical protein [Candidatus Acidoferrales bacterium]